MLTYEDTTLILIGLAAIIGGTVLAARPFFTRRKDRREGSDAGPAMLELVGIGMICMGLLVFFLGFISLIMGTTG